MKFIISHFVGFPIRQPIFFVADVLGHRSREFRAFWNLFAIFVIGPLAKSVKEFGSWTIPREYLENQRVWWLSNSYYIDVMTVPKRRRETFFVGMARVQQIQYIVQYTLGGIWRIDTKNDWSWKNVPFLWSMTILIYFGYMYLCFYAIFLYNYITPAVLEFPKWSSKSR